MYSHGVSLRSSVYKTGTGYSTTIYRWGITLPRISIASRGIVALKVHVVLQKLGPLGLTQT